MSSNTDKALAQLQTLCAKQECCSKDIYAKALKKCDGDPAAAGEIVRKLKEDKYVDDRRYASSFCRDKSSLTGWGPHKIRFALKAKGMDEETIAAALQEIDSVSASDKLTKLLVAKAKSLKGDPQERLKLIRFALTRGYEYSQVESAINKLKNEDD